MILLKAAGILALPFVFVGLLLGMLELASRAPDHPSPAPAPPAPAPAWASPLKACDEIVAKTSYRCPDGNVWKYEGPWTQGAEVPKD